MARKSHAIDRRYVSGLLIPTPHPSPAAYIEPIRACPELKSGAERGSPPAPQQEIFARLAICLAYQKTGLAGPPRGGRSKPASTRYYHLRPC